MNDHHIYSMTTKLLEAGLVSDRAATEKALAAYWRSKIAIVWTTDDARGVLVNDMNSDKEEPSEEWESCITEEKAIKVLKEIERLHDPSYGVTWDTIHSAAVDATRTVIYLKD